MLLIFKVELSRRKRLIFIAVVLLIPIVALFCSTNYFANTIILALVFAYFYNATRINDTESITVDPEARTVTFVNKNSLGEVTVDIVAYDQIFFTYRNRQVTRYNRGDVCIIESAKKTYAFLEPGKDGWKDRDIRAISKLLAGQNVRRVTDRYDDKDVDLH